MAEKKNTNRKTKKWIFWVLAGLCVSAAVVAAVLFFGNKKETPKAQIQPTLTVETPQKISRTRTEEIILDVTISSLGDQIYPAMSMSISFDSSRLEFLGIREGNVFVQDSSNSSGQQLPEWSCNVENSNQTGMINVMYLDMTGGKHAFSQKLLAEEDNVVLRLAFRLRGSVRSGDVLDLIVEDAVFATSDETKSLATTKDTLKVKHGKIVIGE